jgi:hypothetical protein
MSPDHPDLEELAGSAESKPISMARLIDARYKWLPSSRPGSGQKAADKGQACPSDRYREFIVEEPQNLTPK